MNRHRIGLLRNLLFLGLAGLVLLSPHRAGAQPMVSKTICFHCSSFNDTSASPGIVSMSRAMLIRAANPPVAFVGLDRGLRFAAPFGTDWQIEAVDLSGAASGCSMELDALGEPMISYRDGDRVLRLAHRVGSSWATEIVDADGGVAGPTSIARVPGGVGIAYQDSALGELRYAEKIGAGPWTRTTVAAFSYPGIVYPSLAADGSGSAIAYYEPGGGDLMFAVRTSTSWSISLVDSAGNVGGYASLVGGSALGGYGVAYYDFGNTDLRFAYQAASGWVVETVDAASAADVGRFCSAAMLGSTYSDMIGIAYYDRTSGAMRYSRKQSSVWSLVMRDTVGNPGAHTACAGNPASIDTVGIAYVDLATGDLRYRWAAAALAFAPEAPSSARLRIEWLRASGGSEGRLRFVVPAAGDVRVAVLDAQGRIVAVPLHQALLAGPALVRWDGRDARGTPVRAGVYFARVETQGGSGNVPAIILR